MNELLDSKLWLQEPVEPQHSASPDIYYLSDIHFDGQAGEQIGDAAERVAVFIQLAQQTEHALFVLAGDFFSDFRRTLSLFAQMEAAGIDAFVVLGNHDYWNHEGLSYRQMIKLASEQTENYQHTRLLVTGRVYTVAGLRFIGDSGFSSFKRGDVEIGYEDRNLFRVIPDVANNAVADWRVADIRSLNTAWVRFANDILVDEAPTVVVTHWPMHSGEVPVDDGSAHFHMYAKVKTWWHADSGLLALPRSSWYIFGHTHTNINTTNKSDICRQTVAFVDSWGNPRNIQLADFGALIPLPDAKALTQFKSALPNYFNPRILDKDAVAQQERVRRLGFKRAGNAVNKKIIFEYQRNPAKFCQDTLDNLVKFTGALKIGGYTFKVTAEQAGAVPAIQQAVAILRGGYTGNPFQFVTALIVAGYAWGGNTAKLHAMRPVNIYDVVRETLILKAMNTLAVGKYPISTVRRSERKRDAFELGGVEMYLPIVNGNRLEMRDCLPLINSMRAVIGQQPLALVYSKHGFWHAVPQQVTSGELAVVQKPRRLNSKQLQLAYRDWQTAAAENTDELGDIPTYDASYLVQSPLAPDWVFATWDKQN